MRILIADDETKLGSLFKMILCCEFQDSTVDVVVNGAEAVDAFRSVDYDILLLDLNMPVKDGYHAYLEIREICMKEHLKLPFVIFCSGFAIPEELREIAGDPTHCAILRKPVTCEKLTGAFKALNPGHLQSA